MERAHLPIFVRLGPAGERAVRARVDETPEELARSLALGLLEEASGRRRGDGSTDADATSAAFPSQLCLTVRGGRRLDPRAPLARQCGPWTTLELVAPLRGGGGDGGATGAESRSSYLEMYARRKEDPGDPAAARRARWTTCALSGEPLRPPVALDEAGALYNKDAVLTALLERRIPDAMRHVDGLGSIVELKPSGGGQGSKVEVLTSRPAIASLFACPITGMPFVDPNHFVVHRPTGQVFSVRATREAREAVEDMTGGHWRADEWTPVNPPEDEAAELRRTALLRAEDRKRLKREKKEKKKNKGNLEAKRDGEENGSREGRNRPGERSRRGSEDLERDGSSRRPQRGDENRRWSGRDDVRRRDGREESDERRRDGREESDERKRELREDGRIGDRRGTSFTAPHSSGEAPGPHRRVGRDSRESSHHRSRDAVSSSRRSSRGDVSPRSSGAKRARVDTAPTGADPSVWNSIFKDRSKEKDSYMCRGNVGRGMAL